MFLQLTHGAATPPFASRTVTGVAVGYAVVALPALRESSGRQFLRAAKRAKEKVENQGTSRLSPVVGKNKNGFG
jgi:hypothetical protein